MAGKFKLLVFIFSAAVLILPSFVLAAVSFEDTTNLTIPSGSISLSVSSGSSADSLTVNTDNLSISLSSGQSITINSSGRRLFTVSGNTYTESTLTCETSQSVLVLNLTGSGLSETITVTPSDTFCSSGTSSGGSSGGGGGGGGSGTTTPTPASTPAPATVTETPATSKTAYEIQLENIYKESKAVRAGKGEVLASVGKTEDSAAERAAETKYVAPLVSSTGMSVSGENKAKMVSFVNYGTETTLRLGAGERAGVLYCFQDVHGRLPSTEDDWDDVLKIANGRWPKQTSASKEAEATVKFKQVYLREPNRSNPHDDAAVVVMAYGLKPVHRSLESEKAATKTFKYVYGRLPSSNMDWKIIRAIAESGATR